MSEHISQPHKLIVTCSDIEEGILDYDIIHPAECETVTEPMCRWVNGEGDTAELVEDWEHTYEHYTCVVQWVIDNIAIDELREQITGEMSGYPPSGEYEFVGYSRYYPSTPWGGEDYESGLELIT